MVCLHCGQLVAFTSHAERHGRQAGWPQSVMTGARVESSSSQQIYAVKLCSVRNHTMKETAHWTLFVVRHRLAKFRNQLFLLFRCDL